MSSVIRGSDNFLTSNILKSASNPTANTNPTGNVSDGIILINYISGEIFVCTDATTNANHWLGTAGTVV